MSGDDDKRDEMVEMVEMASSEWLALGRELRLEDRVIHDRALSSIRGLAAALRTRKAAGRAVSAPFFGAQKVKISA